MRKNVSGYALQEAIRDPDTNAVVSRPDMPFEHQRVAIYADGKAFHSSPEQIEHDTRVRTRVKELGYKVLYFPGGRIYHNVEDCVADILHALESNQRQKLNWTTFRIALMPLNCTSRVNRKATPACVSCGQPGPIWALGIALSSRRSSVETVAFYRRSVL